MNEDMFFAANNYLNSVIVNRYEDMKKGVSKRKEETNDFQIYYAASDIVASNGIIETSNEELKEVFNKVYEVSQEIIKYYDEVNEKKKLVTDEKILDENKENYLLARKNLIITYRKAYVITHEAFQKMFKRPEM